MFFVLSKLTAALLFPLPLFCLATLLCVWRMKPGWPRRMLRAGLLFLWLVSARAFSNPLMRWWEGAYPMRAAGEAGPADAVVVLTGIVNLFPAHGRGDRVEFNDAVERIQEGLRLLRLGRAPLLLVTGGSGDPFRQDKSEADLLGVWLEREGVRGDSILLERTSRTTRENARETARIARQSGWRRILLVTSAFHMRRAALCFAAEGLNFEAYPVDCNSAAGWPDPYAILPSAEGLEQSTRVWKEVLGIAGYKLGKRI